MTLTSNHLRKWKQSAIDGPRPSLIDVYGRVYFQ